MTSKRDFSRYFNNQVQSAGTVVISKSEDIDYAEFVRIKEKLNLSDKIVFTKKHYSLWDSHDWDKVFNRKLIFPKNSESIEFKDIGIPKEQELESISVKDSDIVNPDELYHVLDELCTGKYGRIIRAKGYLNKNKPFRFELVEGKFMISGIDSITNSRAVVIGKDLKREAIKKLFKRN